MTDSPDESTPGELPPKKRRKREPKPKRDRLCGNCLHFKSEEDDTDVGECHEGPPVVLYDVEQGAFSVYPMVSAGEDWCSRHRGNQ